jgi:hypothetical protein
MFKTKLSGRDVIARGSLPTWQQRVGWPWQKSWRRQHLHENDRKFAEFAGEEIRIDEGQRAVGDRAADGITQLASSTEAPSKSLILLSDVT